MNLKPALQRHKGKLVPLLLIGLIAYMWFRPPAWVQDMNEPLPPIPFTTLDGRQGSLDSLRGKVVLVNFWATWCPYCRHEMPEMQAFYRDYAAKGFEIVAFSVDDDAGKAQEYFRAAGYRFPAAMADISTQQAFGGVSRIPTSFIIDRDGKLRHKVNGQVYYGRLKGLVEPLLK